MCEAIGARRLVRLRYGDDAAHRLFAPYAVFHATTGKVNVAGVQVENPADADPSERPERRSFEVRRIASLTLTDDPFEPDARFDLRGAQYRLGFVCRV